MSLCLNRELIFSLPPSSNRWCSNSPARVLSWQSSGELYCQPHLAVLRLGKVVRGALVSPSLSLSWRKQDLVRTWAPSPTQQQKTERGCVTQCYSALFSPRPTLGVSRNQWGAELSLSPNTSVS